MSKVTKITWQRRLRQSLKKVKPFKWVVPDESTRYQTGDNDVVERLIRMWRAASYDHDTVDDAIDEVERLRAELDKFRSDDDLWKHAQEMGYEKVIDEQQQRIAELESQQVWLYNQGYAQGHHDTVEGMYTDVLPCDMNTYHDDVVADLLAEALKEE